MATVVLHSGIVCPDVGVTEQEVIIYRLLYLIINLVE